ncbi:facilitated trehalose transporter Tret1-like [Drosophila suzukii]|uniref:Facilitated trehalose transporter Tret1-like n=1 Tax=Drosophila suzukii TaxID=28584 RepID=A0ABM4TKJ6_DROSZ
MVKIFKNSLLLAHALYQLLATLIVNIITFGHGVGVACLSPTLTKIQTADSPLAFKVNIDEISWMGSMLELNSLCGNLFIAFLLERADRKFCIYQMTVPYAVSWFSDRQHGFCVVLLAVQPMWLCPFSLLKWQTPGGFFMSAIKNVIKACCH